jgi:hypothetical protein
MLMASFVDTPAFGESVEKAVKVATLTAVAAARGARLLRDIAPGWRGWSRRQMVKKGICAGRPSAVVHWCGYIRW